MYLNASELAEWLRLSVQTIRRYTMKKEIPFHKINRAVRYKINDLDLWIKYKRTFPVKELCEKIINGTFYPSSITEKGVDLV